MRSLVQLSLVTLSSVAFVLAADRGWDQGVITLTDDTFEAFVKNISHGFVSCEKIVHVSC